MATLRGVAPGLAASRISTSSMPCRASRTRSPAGSATPVGVGAPAQLDLDDGLAHGQVGQLLGHARAEVVAGGRGAPSDSATAAATSGGLELGRPRRRGRSTRSSAVTSSSRRAARVRDHASTSSTGLAVLPGEHAEGRPALLHVAEPLRVELDVLEVCREVGRPGR